MEPVTTGQKRKRVTRQQTNEDKKRKEIAEAAEAFSSYIPPAKPTKKSSEVYVQPIKDVCTPELERKELEAKYYQALPSQQTVDDEDGHFIVNENSDLTERCKLRAHT